MGLDFEKKEMGENKLHFVERYFFKRNKKKNYRFFNKPTINKAKMKYEELKLPSIIKKCVVLFENRQKEPQIIWV